MVAENIESSYSSALGDYEAIATKAQMAPLPSDVWQDINDTQGALYPENVTMITPVYSVPRTISYNSTDLGVSVLQSDYSIIGVNKGMLGTFDLSLQSYDRTMFKNQSSVWEAVESDPSLAVIDANLMKGLTGDIEGNAGISVGIGDKISIIGNGVPQYNVTVVGITNQRFLDGVFVSDGLVRDQMHASSPTILLIDFKQGLDPEQQSTLLGDELLKDGIIVISIEQATQELENGVLQGTVIFDAFLSICVITVLTGVTVQALRSVQERGRELELLRTLGFTKRMQTVGMLFETIVPIITGLLIGLATGVVLSYMLWDALLRSTGFYLSFSFGQIIMIDLVAVLLIVSVVYLVVSRFKDRKKILDR